MCVCVCVCMYVCVCMCVCMCVCVCQWPRALQKAPLGKSHKQQQQPLPLSSFFFLLPLSLSFAAFLARPLTIPSVPISSPQEMSRSARLLAQHTPHLFQKANHSFPS